MGPAGPTGATGATGSIGTIVRVVGTPVTIQATDGGTDVKTATATCGAGQTLIGGGFTVTGINTSLDTAYPTANYPSSSTTWSTTMALYGISGVAGTLTACAICKGGPPT